MKFVGLISCAKITLLNYAVKEKFQYTEICKCDPNLKAKDVDDLVENCPTFCAYVYKNWRLNVQSFVSGCIS